MSSNATDDEADHDAERQTYLTTAIGELREEISSQYTGSGEDDDLYESLDRIAQALGLAPTN